ncbi:putative 50S ribosomal protein L10, insertion domain superfamily [Helianthus anomalus]
MFNVLCLTSQVELKEGPLDRFTHEMEPFLRNQGMLVPLNKGIHYISYKTRHTKAQLVEVAALTNFLISMFKV